MGRGGVGVGMGRGSSGRDGDGGVGGDGAKTCILISPNKVALNSNYYHL